MSSVGSGLRSWSGAVARLAWLLAALGLATGRLGTIAHELVGHGGAVLATGGTVTGVQLFWFGGGWINYDDPTLPVAVVIAVAGVAIELAIGIAIWLVLARRHHLVALLLRGLGAALVIHACTYFASGTWYGYGDGRIAHRELGDWRYALAIALALLAAGATYRAARLVYAPLSRAVPGPRAARFAGVVIAAAIAVLLQLVLQIGEARVRADARYAQGMQPDFELAERHREPPFVAILMVLLVASAALGAWHARDDAASGEVSRRLLVRASIAALASIAIVIALDLMLH